MCFDPTATRCGSAGKTFLLWSHIFVEILSRRMGKHIEHIPPEAMSALALYEWPGNIRELQNFIERSVILSAGSALRPPLAELKRCAIVESTEAITLEKPNEIISPQTLEQTRLGGRRP